MRHIPIFGPIFRPIFQAFLGVLMAALILGSGAGTSPANADPLDDFRNAGVIGERFDGYLEARDSAAGADARALIRAVNDKRRAVYTKRASEQGVSPDAVGRVYAQRIAADVPRGVWIKSEGGGWSQK